MSRFCGRLMIPFGKNREGLRLHRPKAFCDSEWGEKSPKYAIHPKPTYSKKANCFNHDLANKAVNEKTSFLLVEGQLDAIRCWVEDSKPLSHLKVPLWAIIRPCFFKNQIQEEFGACWMVMTQAKRQPSTTSQFSQGWNQRPLFHPSFRNRPRSDLARARRLRLQMIWIEVSPIEYAIRYKLEDIPNHLPRIEKSKRIHLQITD